jgi:hypothetical protein
MHACRPGGMLQQGPAAGDRAGMLHPNTLLSGYLTPCWMMDVSSEHATVNDNVVLSLRGVPSSAVANILGTFGRYGIQRIIRTG